MIRFTVVILLALVALLLLPSVSFTQEAQLQCTFHGTVLLDDEPVDDGTVITAIFAGDRYTTTATSAANGTSSYSLQITIPEGTEYSEAASITFIIGTIEAAEKAHFEPKGDILLNLTAVGEIGSVTLVPTVVLLLLVAVAIFSVSPLRRRLNQRLTSRYLIWLGLAGAIVAIVILLSRLDLTFWDFPTDLFIPLRDWTNTAVQWLTDNLEPIFNVITTVIREPLVAIRKALLWLPWWAVLIIFTTLGWRIAGRGIAALTGIGLLFIGTLGHTEPDSIFWELTMVTISIMVVSVVVSILIGIPTGIIAGRSDRFEAAIRPILDTMQTMPSFVYLVPAVIFFGLGSVPAVIATVIYAVPPCIRLTNLGIRQVSADVVEAGKAFGSTPTQLLFKIQLPLAMPSIMAGVTQTVMLALAMVVIGSMIGAGGLGLEVLRGIQQLNTGKAFTAGLGIVIVAIILDRITQNIGKERKAPLGP